MPFPVNNVQPYIQDMSFTNFDCKPVHKWNVCKPYVALTENIDFIYFYSTYVAYLCMFVQRN